MITLPTDVAGRRLARRRWTTLAGLLLPLVAVAPTNASSVSFTNEVMAVLSKAGCNLGGCHGNANGKGGFRLSLRGEDPDFDFQWMVRQAEGRRINSLEPAQSLVLLKPSGKIAHQGGVRFAEDSLEYRLLRDWIAGGAKRRITGERQLLGLEVSPQQQYLYEPDKSVRLRVEALFDDGSRRDVSRLAAYELSNLVAEVADDGCVTRRTYGETTVVVRYLHLQVPVRLAFVAARPDFVWSASPESNYIDRLTHAKLRKLRINPAGPVEDAGFVRRAYLDALGVPPSAEEARRFVASPAADKRRRLIDALLARPEFADHWALKFCDILRVEEKVLDEQGVAVFHGWIREQIAAGLPLDQFVRALIRATGSTYENPPANFWRSNRDPAARAETTARLFLGARLQCARCHNHPFDRWTQDDYYSWAAVFARVDYEIIDNKRRDGLDKNEFVGEQIVKVGLRGSVTNPRTGERASPRLLGGVRLGPGAHYDRLTPLAVWLASPDNRRFAEVQANFVWYHLMGRGLVEPVDDFRATNPPANEALLSALASDLVERGFDLRHLVRRIMSSQTYQRSAEPAATGRAEDHNFEQAIIYRLPAEKLLDCQTAVLGVPVQFAGYPRGLRAGQLPGVKKVRRRDAAPAPGDRFLRAFGKPERLLACECERSNETTLSQAFLLIGGDLHRRLSDPSNRLAEWAASTRSDEQVIEELYWTALSRPPGSVEREAAVAYLAAASDENCSPQERGWARILAQLQVAALPDDRFARLQDIAWALLNSKEFLLRH